MSKGVPITDDTDIIQDAIDAHNERIPHDALDVLLRKLANNEIPPPNSIVNEVSIHQDIVHALVGVVAAQRALVRSERALDGYAGSGSETFDAWRAARDAKEAAWERLLCVAEGMVNA